MSAPGDRVLLRRAARRARPTRGACGSALVAVLLAGACVEAPERGERAPPVALPEHFAAPADASVDSAEPPSVDAWCASFAGERGADLVREALDANPDLRATAARLDAARARAAVTGADGLPQVDASFSRDRSKRNLIGVPIPGAPSPLTVRSTQYDLALGVSWEPDLWGRLASDEQAALADVQAAADDLAAARLSLAAAVLRAWVGLLESAQQVALAERTVASWHDDVELVRKRFAGGRGDAVAVELVASNAAAAEAALAARQRLHERAVRALEILLGRYPSAELAADDELPALDDTPPPGMPAALLARRPDLRAAERRLRAGELRRDARDAALYPSLKLTGSVGTSSEDLGDLLDGDFGVWRLLGQLVQPIWEGGRLRAAVDVADADARVLSEAFARAVLAACAEVEDALSAEGWLRDEEQARVAALDSAARARGQLAQRWRAGSGDVLELLEAERGEDSARSALLAVRRARLDARLDLLLALGGGFEDAPSDADAEQAAPHVRVHDADETRGDVP
ncbi:MAG: TolC family protein [Planctomycetes bacterium]|nr:TolC family protein [Planctomycetota bacterium]